MGGGDGGDACGLSRRARLIRAGQVRLPGGTSAYRTAGSYDRRGRRSGVSCRNSSWTAGRPGSRSTTTRNRVASRSFDACAREPHLERPPSELARRPHSRGRFRTRRRSARPAWPRCGSPSSVGARAGGPRRRTPRRSRPARRRARAGGRSHWIQLERIGRLTLELRELEALARGEEREEPRAVELGPQSPCVAGPRPGRGRSTSEPPVARDDAIARADVLACEIELVRERSVREVLHLCAVAPTRRAEVEQRAPAVAAEPVHGDDVRERDVRRPRRRARARRAAGSGGARPMRS